MYLSLETLRMSLSFALSCTFCQCKERRAEVKYKTEKQGAERRGTKWLDTLAVALPQSGGTELLA